MGRYIAHTRRKRKLKTSRSEPVDVGSVEAHERDIESQRRASRLELERARAEKEMRAQMRRLRKSEFVVDLSGRRRTAVRAAGIALISATGGLRTLGISLHRLPESATVDLWRANVKFEIPKGFTYYVNDPLTPANIDAMHAMRALAPRVAERLFLGSANKTGDENNLHAAQCLAESYIHKSFDTRALTSDEMRRLNLSLLVDFQNATASRLRCLRGEFVQIVDALMLKTKLSRSDCDGFLVKVYAGFEQYYDHKPAPQLFRPPRDPTAPS
jgi:hypothetical protein